LNIDVATSLVEEWYSVCNICVASVVLKICYFDCWHTFVHACKA
jgi:hypothetical protein